MADLKNRFDKVFGEITAKEPKTSAPASPKWTVSTFEVPSKNREVVDWEEKRRSNLPDMTSVPALLMSSMNIYKESLSALIPGATLEVVILVSSDKASEKLMQACSRMCLQMRNAGKMINCYNVRSTVTESGVQVVAFFNDNSVLDINQMIFEENLSPSKQVEL